MFVGSVGKQVEKGMLKMRKQGTDFWSQVTKEAGSSRPKPQVGDQLPMQRTTNSTGLEGLKSGAPAGVWEGGLRRCLGGEPSHTPNPFSHPSSPTVPPASALSSHWCTELLSSLMLTSLQTEPILNFFYLPHTHPSAQRCSECTPTCSKNDVSELLICFHSFLLLWSASLEWFPSQGRCYLQPPLSPPEPQPGRWGGLRKARAA